LQTSEKLRFSKKVLPTLLQASASMPTRQLKSEWIGFDPKFLNFRFDLKKEAEKFQGISW
jgi:hypothetical protein